MMPSYEVNALERGGAQRVWIAWIGALDAMTARKRAVRTFEAETKQDARAYHFVLLRSEAQPSGWLEVTEQVRAARKPSRWAMFAALLMGMTLWGGIVFVAMRWWR